MKKKTSINISEKEESNDMNNNVAYNLIVLNDIKDKYDWNEV